VKYFKQIYQWQFTVGHLQSDKPGVNYPKIRTVKGATQNSKFVFTDITRKEMCLRKA